MENNKLATKKFASKILKKSGYWYRYNPEDKEKYDIIAIKDTNTWIITTLNANNSVSFSKIESEKVSFMAHIKECAKFNNIGFAIYNISDKNLYWLSYEKYLSLKKIGKTYVKFSDLVLFSAVVK